MRANVQTTRPSTERGFSMVELMVAMLITLIVSGAIYGLLSMGGNAFRREPELADRQQNIRIAIDAIGRDIESAGSGMPVVSQVFTHTDDPAGGPAATGAGAPLLNGAGPQGVLGAAGMAQRGTPQDTSDNTDILEILIGDESCQPYQVCTATSTVDGTAKTPLWTREFIPANPNGCFLTPGTVGTQGLVMLADQRRFTIQPATLRPNGNGCGSGTNQNGQLNLGASLAEWPVAAALTGQAFLYAARIVRYVIATDPADDPNLPGLWRSETGRYLPTGLAAPNPPGANWQLIARGIEDLQVEYQTVPPNWSNNPGVVGPCAAACTAADYGTVVRRVRVTLSARAAAPNLQGQTVPAGGTAPNAVRGQLTSVFTPRATVLGLQANSTITEWQ